MCISVLAQFARLRELGAALQPRGRGMISLEGGETR